jgi:hypothetical protein
MFTGKKKSHHTSNISKRIPLRTPHTLRCPHQMSSDDENDIAKTINEEGIRQRRKRAPNYSNLWPIALAPVIPAVGIALRPHKRLRFPVTFGIAGVVLVWSHAAALGSSSGTK